MKIAIGSDHAGYEYKRAIAAHLEQLGHQVQDCGCFSSESVDYPDYALPVSRAVAEGNSDKGILICYSGVGMSMSANKIKGIRCVLCSEPVTARLSREHNDTNVLALGAGLIGLTMAKEIISIWLLTRFEGGRHQKRVDKIAELEAR